MEIIHYQGFIQDLILGGISGGNMCIYTIVVP